MSTSMAVSGTGTVFTFIFCAIVIAVINENLTHQVNERSVTADMCSIQMCN